MTVGAWEVAILTNGFAAWTTGAAVQERNQKLRLRKKWKKSL